MILEEEVGYASISSTILCSLVFSFSLPLSMFFWDFLIYNAVILISTGLRRIKSAVRKLKGFRSASGRRKKSFEFIEEPASALSFSIGESIFGVFSDWVLNASVGFSTSSSAMEESYEVSYKEELARTKYLCHI